MFAPSWDGGDSYEKRKLRGEQILALSYGSEPGEDERESAAADAISDILTAIYGPAGYMVPETGDSYRRVWNHEALDKTQALLGRAQRSYEGDSEDYVKEGGET